MDTHQQTTLCFDIESKETKICSSLLASNGTGWKRHIYHSLVPRLSPVPLNRLTLMDYKMYYYYYLQNGLLSQVKLTRWKLTTMRLLPFHALQRVGILHHISSPGIKMVRCFQAQPKGCLISQLRLSKMDHHMADMYVQSTTQWFQKKRS